VIYTILGKLDEAHLYCDRAIESNPNYSEAYNNIGVLYRDEGRIAEAIQCYERCLELDPTSKNAAQNRLLALNYSDEVSVDFVSRAHREWGERYIRAIQGPQPAPRTWTNSLTAQRVLRVGLLSPDFFIHSVSYFVEALLEHADRNRVYLVCYSNVAREDTKTARLRSLADQWRHITGTSAQAICDLVREDGIDILIELTGHTAGNRLDVMAMRAAPVQVTYIGYPNTTGLSGAIDYRISDAVADPVDSTQTYTETLVRLPRCFLCYTPPQGVSEVSVAPATVSNFVTFGSFNNLAKLNDRVLSRWAEIMHRVPHSRLLIKCKPFASDSVRAKMMAALEARGVSSSRVDLLPLLPNTVDHLRAYSLIDIALDSFPYSGTTTTCEALFMGGKFQILQGFLS
jgi:predicted O-linked N-acetylglucosamine transferase (SPINDLY family)